MSTKNVVIIAGPNGAGKSTYAPAILVKHLEVSEFVNADTIAAGLSSFSPDKVAFAAGRIMMARLKELAQKGEDFAFETTLASRVFAPWIKELKQDGYEFHLIFLWLPSPEIAIDRVARRVKLGGHNVPPETIVRRYHKGLRNLFSLYMPLTTSWQIADTSRAKGVNLIATGKGTSPITVNNSEAWSKIEKTYG